MKKIEAEQIGVAAFTANRVRAPALNAEFTKAACGQSETSLLVLLAAYLHGWDIANLAQDAPATMPSVIELNRINSAVA